MILVLTRRMADTPPEEGARLDLVGTALSALGPRPRRVRHPALRRPGGSSQPKPGAPEWLGPLAGDLADPRRAASCCGSSCGWEHHRSRHGPRRRCVDPAMLRNRMLRGGLTAFFFQYLLQAGLFFAVPLFLSVALGLSAIETGVRLLPLSITLLLAAVGVPKVFPHASPRRVVRSASSRCSPASSCWSPRSTPAPDPRSSPGRCCSPASASARWRRSSAAVTVSSVPDEQSGEVGGVQNTVTNLGALDRHRARRRGAHLGAHRVVLHRHRRQPGRPRRPHLEGAGRAGRAASRSSPTPTSKPRSTMPACRRRRARRSSTRTRRPPRRAACVALGARCLRPGRAVPQPGASHRSPVADEHGRHDDLALSSCRAFDAAWLLVEAFVLVEVEVVVRLAVPVVAPSLHRDGADDDEHHGEHEEQEPSDVHARTLPGRLRRGRRVLGVEGRQHPQFVVPLFGKKKNTTAAPTQIATIPAVYAQFAPLRNDDCAAAVIWLVLRVVGR